MRSLLIGCAISAAIFTGEASGQPRAEVIGQPKEIVSTDTIALRADQARTFMFDEAVSKVTLSVEGIAQVTPDTDRTFTIRGLQPGQALVTFYGPDGHVVHRSNLVVDQSRGFVRLYGQRDARGEFPREFIGFYCTSLGCGRADPDKVPVPIETTISDTHQQGNGDGSTVSKTYRGAAPAAPR